MNLNKHLLLWGGIASLLLSGCQDEDFGFTEHEIRTKTSFEKHFGEIEPDQIWDFSSYNLNRLGLGSNFNQTATTRAAWGGVDDTPDMNTQYAQTIENKWYEVPSALVNWIDLNLREEVFNRKRGATNFTLTMPEDRDIVIIPIYQGQAGLISNLCIKSEETGADGQPLFPAGAVWHKSAGIQVVNTQTGAWEYLGGQGFYDHTVGKQTRANAIQLKHDQIKGKFSLYLDIQNLNDPWDGQNGSPKFSDTFMNNKQASSTDGQMVAVSLANDPVAFKAVSDALKEGFSQPTQGSYGNVTYTYSNFMLIGCEDSNMKRNLTTNGEGLALIGTDWDMNDMVFLIAGLSWDNIVTNQTIEKRYMIEDLGASGKDGFDYDFNDIVIDVKQTKTIGSDGKTVTTQRAYLRHLCGTIPWRVKIGDWESDILPGRNYNPDGTHAKTGDPGYDPSTDLDTYGAFASEEGIEITGWDPDANNIIMTAWPNAAGEDIEQGETDWTDEDRLYYLKEVDGTSYTFPRPGDYPFIIACDVTTPWSNEHNSIESTAIVTWKRAQYETELYPGTTPGGSGSTSGGTDSRTDDISSVAVPIVPGDGPVDVNVVLDSWADDILINPEFLQNIEAGYTIKAYIEPANDAKMMYLSMKAPWKSIGDNMEMGTEATTFEVVVTPNNLADLKQYGIALKGVNVKVKAIEIIPGEWLDPERPVIHWDRDYNMNVGDFKPSGWIVATDCQDLNVGDVITVYATANPTGAWGDYVRLQITDSEWHNFAPAQDYMVWPNTPITYQLTITEDILASIKANGFNVQGHSVIFNKVTNSHPTLYSLTAKPASGCMEMGKVTVTPDQARFQAGSTIRIKAEAYEGYRFVSWSDNNTNAERDVIVSEDKMEFIATFEVIPTHTVKIVAGVNGTIKVNGVVADLGTFTTTAPEGKTFVIEAVGNDGYKFSSWSDGGAKKHTITVGNNDLEITASFVEGEEAASCVLFSGFASGNQYQAMAYGGQNNVLSNGEMSLISALDAGYTKLTLTFGRSYNTWFQYFTAQENGSGGWHMMGEFNLNGNNTCEIDLTSIVNLVKSENGFVFQTGESVELNRIEAHM